MTQNEAKLLLTRLETLTFDTFIDMVTSITRMDKFNVEDTLEKQATTFGYYGALESEAKRREDKIKDDLELFEAETHTSYKEETAGSIRKATAKDIEAYVLSRPRYVELRRELGEAVYKRSLLSKLLRALEHRKDMAVQIASKARKEMDLTR